MNHLLQGRATDIRNVAQPRLFTALTEQATAPKNSPNKKRLKQLIVSWCCLFNG